MPQVGLHLVLIRRSLFAAKAFIEALPAAVGADGHHARSGEAFLGRIVITVITVVPVWVRRDGRSLRLADPDAPGRMTPTNTNRYDATDALRVQQRPFKCLHPAKGWPGHQFEPGYSQFIKENALQFDHVAHRDPRKICPVSRVASWFAAHGSRCSVATPEDVRADDVVDGRIEGLARANNIRPPGLDIGRTGERVADQYGPLRRIFRLAPGPVGNLGIPQDRATLEREVTLYTQELRLRGYLGLQVSGQRHVAVNTQRLRQRP